MSKWGHLGIFMCLFLSTQMWASIGKVSLLKGDAAVSRNNQTIQLATHSPIEEHDMIVTGNDSQIQLIFEDKTVITLGSSSVLNIQEYLNDAQQPKAKFKFNQGTFKSITGEIGKKAPENFNLETKTATIGIRGTSVAGRVGEQSDTQNVVLLQDPNGAVGQIIVSNASGSSVLSPSSLNMPLPPPQPSTPDMIACLTGQIAVGNGLGNVIVQPGFVTFVGTTQPPAPPVILTPQMMNMLSTTASSAPAPQVVPQQASSTPTATTTVNEITNSALQQSSQDNIITSATKAQENYFVPSKGVFLLEYMGNYKGSVRDFSINEDGIFYFDASANLYTLNPTTWTYGTTATTLNFFSPSYTNNVPYSIPNTGFKTSYASESDVSISPLPSGISSYSVTLYYDELYNEILIAKISATDNNNAMYAQTALIGHQSTALSTVAPVLYYQNYDDLFMHVELGNILLQDVCDPTVLAINTTNRKALGLYMDENGQLKVSIGKVDSHNSLELTSYSLAYYLDNSLNSLLGLSASSYQESNGALYGSANQALAVTGISSNYSRGENTQYDSAINIALLSSAASPYHQDEYATHQTLSGTIIDSSGTSSNLNIQLNKSAGTLSVNSSPLTISSTNSAFISDDYFAALNTGTINGTTTVLKDYLIAIPLETPAELSDNDYVSWGYWSKSTISGNSIIAGTSPFSTWVAGVKTPSTVIDGLISSRANYSYSGKIIGSAYESGSWGHIKTDTSSITLNVNFETASIGGALSFTTSQNNTWSSTITGTSLSAANSSFAANLSGGTASGNLQGNFYGSTAQTAAGSFSLTSTTDSINKAIGSFKAIK